MAEALLAETDARSADDQAIVAWRPRSAPQAAYITCPVFEIFYGGARGSLKTEGTLGDWLNHSHKYGEDAVGLMVRRTREQLKETFERAKRLYVPLGFHPAGHTITSPQGARLRFAYLERDEHAENYQGDNNTRVYVEELGNFPNPAPVMKLMATLRSTKGVHVGFRGTGNPGGPGHGWVKARYITPAREGWKIVEEPFINPWTGEKVMKQRIFIPGKITDHNLLGADYIANLQMSGSPELVRAWLEGDWDVVAGAYFPEFSRGRHVLEPRTSRPTGGASRIGLGLGAPVLDRLVRGRAKGDEGAHGDRAAGDALARRARVLSRVVRRGSAPARPEPRPQAAGRGVGGRRARALEG
jgi:hypothetical protein